MPGKKTCQSVPHNLTQAVMILLLSSSGGMILPHMAQAQESPAPEAGLPLAVSNWQPSPELIQSWKNYLKNYPAVLAKYQKDQDVRRRAAQVVRASEEKNMDDLVKVYPFLRDDFQKVKDMQQNITDYANKNLDHSIDVSPHIQTAESRDKINILFVSKSGKLWCGGHGCSMDVYVDDGSGYEKANQFIASQDISLSRVDGQVALYFGPPQDPNTPEWILKDHKFSINRPPPSEPFSQAYVGWRQQLESAGTWPPQ